MSANNIVGPASRKSSMIADLSRTATNNEQDESPMIFERDVEDPCMMNSTSTISRQTSNTSLLHTTSNQRKYSTNSNTGLNLYYTHTVSSSPQVPNSSSNSNNNNQISNASEYQNNFPNISKSSTNVSMDNCVEQEVIYQNPMNHRRTLENFVPPALDEGCSIVTDDATDLEDVDMVFVQSRKPSTLGLDMALGRTRSMSTLKPLSNGDELSNVPSNSSEQSTSPRLFRFYSYADMLSEDNYLHNKHTTKRPSFTHHSLSSNVLQKSKTAGQPTNHSASNLIGTSPPKTQSFVNPFIISRRYSSNAGPIQTATVPIPTAPGAVGSRSQSNLLRQGSYNTLSPNMTPMSNNSTPSAGNIGNNNNNFNNKPADRFMRTSQRPAIFKNYSASGLSEVGSPTSPTLSLSTSPRIGPNSRSLTTSPPSVTSPMMIKSGRSNSANIMGTSSRSPRSTTGDKYKISTVSARRKTDQLKKNLTKFHIESSGSEGYSTDEEYDGETSCTSGKDAKKKSIDSNVFDDDDNDSDNEQSSGHKSADNEVDPLSEDLNGNGHTFFPSNIKINKEKLQKNLMSSFEKFQSSKIWRNSIGGTNSPKQNSNSSHNTNETPTNSHPNSFLRQSNNSNSCSTITAVINEANSGTTSIPKATKSVSSTLEE